MIPPRYMLRGWIKKWKVRRLLRRDGPRCVYCGCDLVRTVNHARQLTLDHWWPRSRGGSNKLSNLVLACATCNRRKGDKRPIDYYRSGVLRMRILSIRAERSESENSSSG